MPVDESPQRAAFKKIAGDLVDQAGLGPVTTLDVDDRHVCRWTREGTSFDLTHEAGSDVLLLRARVADAHAASEPRLLVTALRLNWTYACLHLPRLVFRIDEGLVYTLALPAAGAVLADLQAALQHLEGLGRQLHMLTGSSSATGATATQEVA